MWKSSNSFNGYWWWEFINGEKVPFIIYADLESLLEKKALVTIILKKSSTTKTNKHTASGYSFLHIVCSMQKKKNLVFSRDKDEKDL